MSLRALALSAIALLLVVAEIVRPTHFAQKKHNAANSVAHSALDATYLDGLPPIDVLALGSIDSIGYELHGNSLPVTAQVAVPRGSRIVIVGWCADPEVKLPAGGAFVSVDGRERIDGSKYLGVDRPDVQTYYDNPALGKAGFRIVFPAALLDAGTHELRFGVIAHDRRGFFPLGGPIDITIR